MRITLNDLIELCKIIIKRSQLVGLEEVEANIDQYWNISPEESHNFDLRKAPVELKSLQSDLDSLNKLLNGERLANSSDFERFGNIMMSLGIEIQKLGIFYGSQDFELD